MQIKKSVAVFIVIILAVVGLNSNQALAAELSSNSKEVAEAGDGYVFNTVPNAIITFAY
ncbi:MAG: hypothetical protein E6600_19075 [Anaerocolumna aminovalerica]|jgi:hypothetical protein|uniref:hypothetical protein n=1 Tax=Anaerocolumna aminovalerica TaxID=1527 RepID=UPI002907C0ED|nr:hypothetical protein [Anaerocolumna aminovalerica]MDU6266599.1 hypothetical protein [Anaerocolumna aminovalerica]